MKEVDLLVEEIRQVKIAIINNDPAFIAAMKASNDAETNWRNASDPGSLICPEWFRYQDAKLNCKKVYHDLIAREGMEAKLLRFHALLQEERDESCMKKPFKAWKRK